MTDSTDDQVTGDMSVTLLCLVFLVVFGFVVYCAGNFLAYSFVRPRQRSPDAVFDQHQRTLSEQLSIPPLFSAKISNNTNVVNLSFYSCSSALVDGWKGIIFYANVLIILGVATSSIDFDKIYEEQKLLLLFSEPAQNFLPVKSFHVSTMFFVSVFLSVLLLALLIVNALLDTRRNFIADSATLTAALFGLLSLCSFYYHMWKLSVVFILILVVSYRFVASEALHENSNFPTKLLRTAAIALGENFQGILSDSVMALFFQAIWALLCSMATYAVTVRFNVLEDEKDQSSQHVIVISIYVWIAISFYWGMECIKDIVALTTSGTVISWAFLPHQPAPVRASFFRATSSLFGSVCYGSLFLTVVQNLRHLLWIVLASMLSDELCSLCVSYTWVARWILDSLEQNVGFLNRYTYAYVAGHGYDLQGAGNHVLDTLERKNVLVLAQDDVLVSSFWLCTIFLTTVSAGVGVAMTALFLYFDNQSKDIESSTAILHHDLSHIDVNVEGGVQVANSLVEEASDALATVYLVGAVYGALVGFAVSSLIMSMLDIAVATVLVCLAEDSEDMEVLHECFPLPPLNLMLKCSLL